MDMDLHHLFLLTEGSGVDMFLLVRNQEENGEMANLKQNQPSDKAELLRLLEEARPIVISMYPDQRKKWVAESPLAQEILTILAKHPEYYGEVGALDDDIFSEFKAGRKSAGATD